MSGFVKYRTIRHDHYPLFGVACDGDNPIQGVVFDTEHAANWVRDALNENGALKARIAELERRELNKQIDATNNAVPLDSGKWAYSIDDSVLEWPSALKEPANEG